MPAPFAFSSLRWRIAAYYTLLLIALVGVIALVLGFEVRAILLDEVQARVDRIGTDIARLATQSSLLGAVGEQLPIEQQLAVPGNLDHWSSPTTFVEIDGPQGNPIGKSSNMGSASFGAISAGGGEPIYRIVQGNQGELLVRAQRLTTADGAVIGVKIGERLDIVHETLRRIFVLLAIVVVLAIVAVLLSSISLASRAIRPIEDLTQAIGEIRSDQLDRRVAWQSRTDEVGRLAVTFDALLARLEEAFARERQFISDASHELKTPLTVIHSNAQMLERWADRDPAIRTESLRAIIDESAALARMVNGMLVLAKAESGDDIPHEPIHLSELLAGIVNSAQPRAHARELELRFIDESPPGTSVSGDPNLLRQLFGNLVENAIKFTERGAIDVRLRTDDDRARIDVADTGIGIEDEALARVFDRFYRTDRSHSRAVEGTGLGLAIVRSIARVHDGTVAAESNANGGTTFSVDLPRIGETLISGS